MGSLRHSSQPFPQPPQARTPLLAPLRNTSQAAYVLPSTQNIRVSSIKRSREEENEGISTAASAKRVKGLETGLSKPELIVLSQVPTACFVPLIFLATEARTNEGYGSIPRSLTDTAKPNQQWTNGKLSAARRHLRMAHHFYKGHHLSVM